MADDAALLRRASKLGRLLTNNHLQFAKGSNVDTLNFSESLVERVYDRITVRGRPWNVGFTIECALWSSLLSAVDLYKDAVALLYQGLPTSPNGIPLSSTYIVDPIFYTFLQSMIPADMQKHS